MIGGPGSVPSGSIGSSGRFDWLLEFSRVLIGPRVIGSWWGKWGSRFPWDFCFPVFRSLVLGDLFSVVYPVGAVVRDGPCRHSVQIWWSFVQ